MYGTGIRKTRGLVITARIKRWCVRASVAAVVTVVHVLLIASVSTGARQSPLWHISVPGNSLAIAEIISKVPSRGEAFASAMEPRMLPVAVDAPRPVQVRDLEERSLGPTTAAPAVSPRLSPSQSAEVGEYAKRAGVAPGPVVTADASQTVAYPCSALGRIRQSQVQSGPRNRAMNAFQYDAAGDRPQYQVIRVTADTAIGLSEV